jgi:type VI secretion system protein ImpE
MTAKDYLKAAKLDEALASLQEAVRSNPADAKLRTFLFQLLCVMGQWERASTQLKVLADMGTETKMLASIFQPVMNCEVLRRDVFDGKRTPIIFGEPQEWMGWVVQANELSAKGQFQGAQELRDKAFEAAPTTSGVLNGQAFEWIADADSRLGPLLEVILEGHYYWVPFCRIKKLHIEAPTDLRDLVWAPAQFLWSNGGDASGHIPTRYAGTEMSADGQLRMARKTDWVERSEGFSVGLGQRVLATNESEHPVLECRDIEITKTG